MFDAQCYIYKFEIRYLANVLYIVIFLPKKTCQKTQYVISFIRSFIPIVFLSKQENGFS